MRSRASFWQGYYLNKARSCVDNLSRKNLIDLHNYIHKIYRESERLCSECNLEDDSKNK